MKFYQVPLVVDPIIISYNNIIKLINYNNHLKIPVEILSSV